MVKDPHEFIKLIREQPANRPSIYWKHKHINVLTKRKTFVKDFDVTVEKNSVNVGHIKFAINGRITNEIRSLLPIPLGRNSRLIGKFNGSIPAYKGKIVYNDSKFGEFVGSKMPELLNNIKYKATYPGSWDYNHDNLNVMVQEPKSKFNYDDLINSIKVRGDIDLHVPKMTAFSEEAIDNVRINPRAFSGIMTSKMFGQTMSKSTKFTRKIAKKVFKQCIIDDFIPDNSLWAVAGREKRIDLSTNKDVRTRLVLMCEDLVKLIGNCALQPFTKRLSSLRSGAIMIGRSMEDRKFYKFIDEISESKYFGVVDGDWSQFDNHCYEELIVTAFGIIRSCYPEGKFYDNYFLWNCCSMIFKNIVLPESKLIYKISKGIASGHPYTSVIGSLINWLLWSTAIVNACPEHVSKQTVLKCMGDDTLAKLPYGYIDNIEHQISLSGMKFDNFSHRCGPLWANYPNSSKTFLKKIYNNGGISWDLNSIVDNLLYPPKIKDIDGEIQRVRMLMYTAPSESKTTNILTNYFYFLCDIRIRDGPEHDSVKRFISDRLRKSWPISLRLARKWFYDIRNYDSIGLRQDDWDTKTTYGTSYDYIPSYTYNYGAFTLLFNDYV
jgi:hypothetical protein